MDEIMSFSEACQKWGLSDSTLRCAARNKMLIKGVDYRKTGGVCIITKDAMIKHYGFPVKKLS